MAVTPPLETYDNNILEYSLELGGTGFKHKDDNDKEVDGCPPIVTGERTKVTYKDISDDLLLSLYGVTFRRKIYEPGRIQAELQIQTKSELGIAKLSDMLVGRSVSLHIEKNSSGRKTIAKNYFILDISPQFENGTDNTYKYIYIKLNIVSKDALLKFNRFSQAHLGEKFFSDTVTNFTSAAGVPIRAFDKSSFQGLTYKDNNTDVEYIQPYFVQYNESFYDFMRRIANRCGEAFYFEDGTLCFGLPKNGNTTDVVNALRVIYRSVSDGPYSCKGITVSDYARDSLKELRDDNTYKPDKKDVITDKIGVVADGKFPNDVFSDGDYTHNSEIASEDHYMILFKDKFAHDSSDELWLGDQDARITLAVSAFLNSTSLLEAIGNLTEQQIDAAYALIAKAKKVTDAGNTKVEDERLDSNKDYAVLFAKVDDNTSHWITLNYYKDIRKYEEEQARNMVCIDMGERYCDVKLGDKITIPGDDDSTYIVTDIEMTSGVPWKRRYDEFSGDAVPVGGAQSQRFYAIPLTKDSKFYPPLLTDKPFLSAGPQPAYVVEVDDPYHQGRVRIRYPWQSLSSSDENSAAYKAKSEMDKKETELKKYATVTTDHMKVTITKKSDAKEDDFNKAEKEYNEKRDAWLKAVVMEAASPWIRMATPMATNGGGMFFRPEVGDEVMVDYENGNIDRPFVTGALYSKNVPAPMRGNHVIVSKNGHTIKLDDPDDTSLIVQSIFPFIKMLGTFGVEFKGIKGQSLAALGGIELTDKAGIYDIKMSSHDRRIKISSPIGDVKVDALTGISIEAPNGDITITGKNINMTAYNKFNITSGKNILLGSGDHLGGFWDSFNKRSVGSQVSKSLLKMSLMKFFDFSLIRTVLEIFVRPIDGSLAVKSYRYMQLEAGKGSTADEPAKYASRPMDNLLIKKSKADNTRVITELVGECARKVEAFVTEYCTAFNALKAAFDAFPDETFGDGNPLERPTSRDTFLKHMFEEAPDKKDQVRTKVAAYFNKRDKFRFHPSIGRFGTRDFFLKVVNVMNNVVAVKAKGAKLEHILDGLPDEYDAFDIPSNAPSILKKAASIKSAPGAAPAPANQEFYAAYVKKIADYARTPDRALFSNDIHSADFAEWKKFTKRRLAHYIIEKCRVNDIIEGCKIPPAVYGNVSTVAADGTVTITSSKPNDNADPVSDADWPKFVAGIQIKDNFVSDFVNGLMDTGNLQIMKKVLPLEWWVWKPESKGRILISDEANRTIRFNNGVTESYKNQDRLAPSDEESRLHRLLNF